MLVGGPLAVGKTTLIRSVSDIPTLHTDETMTQAAAGADPLGPGLPAKTTTTVAIDFGRLTLHEARIVLYLFGTPGQSRFRPLWDGIVEGALGALVLADTSRLEESFPVMDLCEERGLPYAVAVNQFPHAPRVPPDTLRASLDLADETPLVSCDARERSSALDALITLTARLVHHAGATR
ncbi:ATP/GTP-binding protein [Streptomyces sp. NPDC048290]|uniref:GTP-binding protein n=1 Tax=Streptomyces sp. NPDC048290 TaxID=3155811 RepID=UPI00342DB117